MSETTSTIDWEDPWLEDDLESLKRRIGEVMGISDEQDSGILEILDRVAMDMYPDEQKRRCELCYTSNPTWDLAVASGRAWRACGPCKTLAMVGDRDLLVERAVKLVKKRFWTYGSDLDRRLIIREHRGYWQTSTGTATHVPAQPVKVIDSVRLLHWNDEARFRSPMPIWRTSVGCAACNERVHLFTTGGSTEWRHEHRSTNPDHPPKPVIGDRYGDRLGPELECSFCTEDGAGWVHLTRNGNGWTACDTCHRLVVAGKQDRLAERVISIAVARDRLLAGLPAESAREVVLEALSPHWASAMGISVPIV